MTITSREPAVADARACTVVCRPGVGREGHQIEVDPRRAHHHDRSGRRRSVPVATHGTGSLMLARGTGGGATASATAPTRDGSAHHLGADEPLAPEPVQRVRVGARADGAGRRPRRCGSTTRRRARRRGASRTLHGRARPRRPRAGCCRGTGRRRPGTPRARAPRPTSTPCSSTGSAPASTISARNC